VATLLIQAVSSGGQVHLIIDGSKVSVWASQNGIALGQRKVNDKPNEITAIPELLRLLDVSGCIVTISPDIRAHFRRR